MKVILLKDIPKLGQHLDVKDVSDGYALNMLIPRGLVEAATERSLKRVEQMKKEKDAERKIQEDLLEKNLKEVGALQITLTEKANEKGHLFAQIHKEEISRAIKTQSRLDILPEFIMLEKPIKEVGNHEIEVRVGEKKAKFKVVVNPIV